MRFYIRVSDCIISEFSAPSAAHAVVAEEMREAIAGAVLAVLETGEVVARCDGRAWVACGGTAEVRRTA